MLAHLSIADNLQSIWMKDSGQCLVELVKLVNLFVDSIVPQNTVGQDQLVGWVETGAIPGGSYLLSGCPIVIQGLF